MFKSEKLFKKARAGAEAVKVVENSGGLQQALDRISKSLHSEEYVSGSDQELVFNYGGSEVAVRYSDISAEQKEIIVVAQKHWKDIFSAESPVFEAESWKQLNGLSVRTQDGKAQDMLESVPAEYPIFFCPQNDSSNPKGVISGGDINAIFYAGDIATLAGMSVLAHEIGHLHNEYLKTEEERMRTTNHRDQDVATKVLRERYANAFALKKLRPFITNLQNRKDISALLLQYGQGSYDTLLTKVRDVRDMHEQAAFYRELGELMRDDEYDYEIYGLDDWDDSREVGLTDHGLTRGGQHN